MKKKDGKREKSKPECAALPSQMCYKKVGRLMMVGRLSKLLRLRANQTGDLVRQDTALLMASFGDGAYDVARTRARDSRLAKVIDGNRPPGHWDKVRRAIGKPTERGWPGSSPKE
jgi:hypothetical protein